MAKKIVKKAATDVTVYLMVYDSTSTTGGRKTGLAYNTASLTAYYVRDLGSATSISLATQTITGAHSDGGFVEVSSFNMPGLYRLDLPDAVCATGASAAVVTLKGATGMVQCDLEIELVNYDPADGSTLGLTGVATASALTTVDDLVDDLESRLTATRAGYLDNLSGGAVATAAALTTVDDFLDTEIAAIKTKTDYLPSATAGAAGGLFIAGSNAATSIATALTANITGNLSGSVGSVTNERAKYMLGAVWIGPTANTNTTSYVDGIMTNPVSTIAAAKTIADALGLKRFWVQNKVTVTLAASYNGYVFDSAGGWSLTTSGTQSLGDATVRNAKSVTGTFSNAGGGSAYWEACEFGATVSIASGNFLNCTFGGTTTLNSTGNYDFIDCASVVAGTGTPVFAVPAGVVNLSFRRWSGGIRFTGITTDTTISIDMVSGGTVTLEGADGNVQVRGMVAGITDSRTGAPTLGQNAAINMTKVNTEADTALTDYDAATGTDVTNATSPLATAANLTTLTNYVDTEVASILAAVDTEVAAIKAKTDNLPSDPADQSAVEAAITAAVVSAATIADAVWDEALSGHGTAGSAGAALSTASSGGVDAGVLADAIWDEALSGHSTAGTTGKKLTDLANADLSGVALESTAQSILTDTAVIGAAGAGLTAVPWNAGWDAEVQSEVTDALAVYDPPTKAELDAADDAVLAAIAALNNLSSAGAQAAAAAALAAYDAATGTDVTTAVSGLSTFDAATDAVIVGTIQTDAITAAAIATAAAQEIADAILARSVSGVEATAAEHSLATIILAALESAIVDTTWTIKRTDGTTTHLVKTVATDADAEPVTGVS